MSADNTRIGKIESIRFGMGGYQDAMFGITFSLSGKGWGIGDFWGTWETRSEHAKFSEQEWRDIHAKTVIRLAALMNEAKCTELHQLEGKPIEVTFDGDGLCGSRLQSWRILTEVL